jgi:hypothetical protein
MSQIDKIIYIPLLFWFIILILILYSIIFVIFLSQFLSINKIRFKYINNILEISQITSKITKYMYNLININILKLKNLKIIKIKKI